MKTIWKYPLSASTVQTIHMPTGAQILTAQVQRDDICLWALIDENYQSYTARRIEVLCTGSSEPEASRIYIATVQMNYGAWVFHVFERVTQVL